MSNSYIQFHDKLWYPKTDIKKDSLYQGARIMVPTLSYNTQWAVRYFHVAKYFVSNILQQLILLNKKSHSFHQDIPSPRFRDPPISPHIFLRS